MQSQIPRGCQCRFYLVRYRSKPASTRFLPKVTQHFNPCMQNKAHRPLTPSIVYHFGRPRSGSEKSLGYFTALGQVFQEHVCCQAPNRWRNTYTMQRRRCSPRSRPQSPSSHPATDVAPPGSQREAMRSPWGPLSGPRRKLAWHLALQGQNQR